jgi:hypothetical protein
MRRNSIRCRPFRSRRNQPEQQAQLQNLEHLMPPRFFDPIPELDLFSGSC